MLEKHIATHKHNFDGKAWREKFYLKEPVDAMLKSYISIIKAVFNIYKTTGEYEFVDYDAFQQFCKDAELINDVNKLQAHNVSIMFNYSKMTRKRDEEAKQLELTFPEFLEAFARVVDISQPMRPVPSVMPQEKYATVTGQILHEEHITYLQTFTDRLHLKIEFVMPFLLELCDKEFADNYEWPMDCTLFAKPPKVGQVTLERKKFKHKLNLLKLLTVEKDNPINIKRVKRAKIQLLKNLGIISVPQTPTTYDEGHDKLQRFYSQEKLRQSKDANLKLDANQRELLQIQLKHTTKQKLELLSKKRISIGNDVRRDSFVGTLFKQITKKL